MQLTKLQTIALLVGSSSAAEKTIAEWMNETSDSKLTTGNGTV